MKKGVLFFLIAVLLISFVLAQNETIEDKAYNCLKDKVKDKCSTLSLEEAAFSLLALSDNSAIQSECKSALKSKQQSSGSFGSIKETALSIIALNYIGEDTSKAESWLLSKTKPSDVEWYLEIDSSNAVQCEIRYDSTSKTINIASNKKISGDPGNCFSKAYDNYWLRIKDSCLDKEFEVSCDSDFITTLLYKKPNTNIWHVSSQVESVSAGGTTINKVNSLCFSESNSCDYEGTLWATLALYKVGNENTSSFIPYLVAFAEDNEEYLPYSFLYYLTNSEDYLQEILNLQKTQGYWDLGKKGKYYDTALALLSLTSSQAKDNAISWLEETQGNNGCWNNNIRDTAFLIWVLWPRTPYVPPTTTTEYCEPTYYCISVGECQDAGGNELDNYYCPGLNICCDRPKREKTCQEMGGKICPSGEICDESTVTASDTAECCLGSCIQQISECEEQGYFCRASCFDTEEETDLQCLDASEVCCKTKPRPEGGGLPWYVWLLIILIILAILAIIFRNRLKVLLFKLKGGVKKGGVTSTRPPFTPPAIPGLRTQMMPRRTRYPLPPPRAPRTAPAAKSRTDKEFEETLKKLREMSK